MKIGKVPNSVLEELIKDIKTRDEVLVGSKIGRDTSILDLENKLIVLSTDPITGATKDIGKLAINISVNDLATEGAEPVAAILTVLAPPKTTEEDLIAIMKDAKERAAKINLAIVGGHTEITDAVNRVVVSTTVIGAIDKPYKQEKIQINDLLVVTKSLALEGTFIIAKEKADEVKRIVSPNEYKEALGYGEMTSVVVDGFFGKKHGAKYMHDVTEGGILGAAWEAAKANDIGLVVFNESLPISDVTKKICSHFSIDPRGLISSGSMLMIISQEDFIGLIPDFEEKNISATIIGRVTDYEGVFLREEGRLIPLGEPKVDELYSIF